MTDAMCEKLIRAIDRLRDAIEYPRENPAARDQRQAWEDRFLRAWEKTKLEAKAKGEDPPYEDAMLHNYDPARGLNDI